MAAQHNFSGTWHCAYWYPSNQHEGDDVSEYRMTVHQRGDKLVLESLPNEIDAHMTVNLTVDGALATGNWLENTSPRGEFQGLVYSGALQLIITDDGRRMEGKWVGVGREKLPDGSYEPQIYSGRWAMEVLETPEGVDGQEAAASGTSRYGASRS